MPKDNQDDLPAAARAAARSNMYALLIAAFDLVCPGKEFTRANHVEAMCFALQQVAEGRSTRLIISVALRHLKSICASVLLPAFLLGLDPTRNIMVISYGGDLAREHAEAFRRLVLSPLYRRLFPATQFSIQRYDQMKTTAGGGRMAVSLAGATTGFGADLIILDDLIKASDVQSAAQRETVRLLFDQAIYSRLNDKAAGAIVCVAQRLHVDDATGYLLEKGSFAICFCPPSRSRRHRSRSTAGELLNARPATS